MSVFIIFESVIEGIHPFSVNLSRFENKDFSQKEHIHRKYFAKIEGALVSIKVQRRVIQSLKDLCCC